MKVRGILVAVALAAVLCFCLWPRDRVTVIGTAPGVKIYRIAWHDGPFADNYAPNIVSHYVAMIGGLTSPNVPDVEWVARLRGKILEHVGAPLASIGSIRYGGLVIFCSPIYDLPVVLADENGRQLAIGIGGSEPIDSYVFTLDSLPPGNYRLVHSSGVLAQIRVR